MNKIVLCVLFLAALAACSNKMEHHAGGGVAEEKVQAPAKRAFLAYAHGLELRVAAGEVSSTHTKLMNACTSQAGKCTVLESRVHGGEVQSASLRMRAAPDTVKSIISVTSKQGEVTEMHTTAEDLAEPIADGTRKLAMLKDYRDKLTALLKQQGNKPEVLIQLTRELAETQGEIERHEGQQAKLMERVETEILNISIVGPASRPFSRPISQAMEEFSDNLSSGIAGAISAVAFLLPSVLLLWGLVWAVIKIRRRRKLKAS